MELEKQTDVNLNYRFSKDAVKALESRVRLYKQDWQGAYDAANFNHDKHNSEEA